MIHKATFPLYTEQNPSSRKYVINEHEFTALSAESFQYTDQRVHILPLIKLP